MSHQAIGLHRRPKQARLLRSRDVELVEGDLTTMGVADFTARLKGADAVVFAAGALDSGPRAADAVDGHGVVVATAATRSASWPQATGLQRTMRPS